jgi:hypothetical protein
MEIERSYATESLSYQNGINGGAGGLTKPVLILQ